MILSIFIAVFTVINAEYFSGGECKNATLKPDSLCCDIPDLGDNPHLDTCSNPQLPGPCNNIQCIFEQSGFLNNNSLNKDAYRNHLKKWAENHKGWTVAVDKAIEDCIDKEPKQQLDEPCKAYDVFTCTELAMTKRCPTAAWKCYYIVTKHSLVFVPSSN